MLPLNYLKLIFVSTLFFISCSSNEVKKNTQQKNKAIEGAYNAEMKAIDTLIETKGQTASSLKFSKEDGTYVLVKAHLNEAGEIIKIEEDFYDGEKIGQGVRSFYFEKDKLIATREYCSDLSDVSNPKFIDRISYYDKNKNVKKTLEKRVDFEEDLERNLYLEVKKHAVSMERAKKVLDQKGEFQVTFQGIIVVNAFNYLIVGSEGEDTYTSTIRVDYDDSFIKKLLSNQKAYLNKKIEVIFERVIDPTGFEYQTYIQGKFVD